MNLDRVLSMMLVLALAGCGGPAADDTDGVADTDGLADTDGAADTDTVADTDRPGDTDDTDLVPVDEDHDGVAAADDCDDADPTSTALADDGDCDGAITAEDCDDADPSSLLVSEDADCDTLLTTEDCDDADPTSTAVADDADCDGYVLASDCDDTDPTVSPDALEFCNGFDENCDGLTDPSESVDAVAYYLDPDGDGYADMAATTAYMSCGPMSGFSTDRTDCDENVAATHPGAPEVCNGGDDDCSGVADDGLAQLTWYPDQDGDGVGGTGVFGCLPDGTPTSLVPGDCDDANAAVYPGATERCDGVANDCDHAATWDPHDEDGVVEFTDAAGVTTDIAADFHGGVTVGAGTLQICGGTYDVELSYDGAADGALVVRGRGRGVTVLTGGTTHRVFTFDVAPPKTLDVADLTLKDGASDGDGGLLVSTANQTLLTRVVLDGGVAGGNGGGAAIGGGSASLDNVTATGCSAQGDGGGLMVTAVLKTAMALALLGNDARDGGGMHLRGSPSFLGMFNGGVEDNTARRYGGGLYVDDGDFVSLAYSVTGNAALRGGGMYFKATHAHRLSSYFVLSLVDNEATERGGGLYVEGPGRVTVSEVDVDGGRASEGGGVAIVSAGDVQLNQVNVHDSVATTYGGGILVDGGTVTLSATKLTANSAQGAGGGLAAFGGASVTLLQGSLDDNHADGSGGGVFLDHSSLAATGTTFTGDTAGAYGGGLALAAAGAVTLDGADVSECSAVFGGALSVDTSDAVTLRGTTLRDNSAAVQGGAVALYRGHVVCEGVDGVGGITGNVATLDGGAGVWLDASGGVVLDLSTCDLGAEGDAADNTAAGPVFGQDVTVGTTTWSFGAATSTTCTQAGCP